MLAVIIPEPAFILLFCVVSVVDVISPELIICVVIALVFIARVLIDDDAFIILAVIIPEPAFILLFCVFIVPVVILRVQSAKGCPIKFI